jgi:hypothetical protein
MIFEPRQSKIEGMKNVSNDNDDVESNILDKGKEKKIQTNEDLDSLSSWEDEELGFALQNFPTLSIYTTIREWCLKTFSRGN